MHCFGTKFPCKTSAISLSQTQQSMRSGFWIFADARTTKCSGCDRPFQKNGNFPEVPNDMVFVTCGKRRYQKKGDEAKIASKSGNVYLHVHKSCLTDGFTKVEQSEVAISTFVTSLAVKERMQVSHKSRLWGALF